MHATLLINQVIQVLKRGLCCWIIDPHGDFAIDVIESAQAEDVIFLDPLRVRFSINTFELPPYTDQYERQMIIERIIVKGLKGRPKIVVKLTKKGLETLGIGVSPGKSQKAGGELHRAIMMKLVEKLRQEGYYVILPKQTGKEEQPDLIAYPREDNNWGNPMAIEIETRGQHPDQIIKNYEKNVRRGYRVVFIALNKEAASRVKNALGKQEVEIYEFSEIMKE
jgi:hypothetical protein